MKAQYSLLILFFSINLAYKTMTTFFVLFLCLLVSSHVIAENKLHDTVSLLGELESFDIYEGEDEEMKTSAIPSWNSGHGGKVLVNVDSFAAIGDGISDDTQAFINAWSQACSAPKSVFLVPGGRRYLVNATRFKGPCETRLTVQIDGTIVAPEDPENWNPDLPRVWLSFSNLTGVVFQGNGVIDGSGSKWWAASCKKNKTNPCKGAPTALTIESSSAIRVKGLTIQNSQQMHFVISNSDSVRISDILISSPGDSPNTDGIHLTRATNVTILNCKIGTGDDCISIVNASSSIKMKKIFCGPGHGISIGSLGKDNSTGIVSKILLNGAFIRNATNGVRVKTYQGGSGYVKAVRFENVMMQDVANPIIIDQFYCDSINPCTNQTTAVQISKIMYRNITGTTNSKQAIKFACSDAVPCRNIILTNIDLKKKDGTTAETYCNSVTGFGFGTINPSADCLMSFDKYYTSIGEKGITQLGEESREDRLIHTEL